MKKTLIKLVALLLTLALTLSGCSGGGLLDMINDFWVSMQNGMITHFEDMEYTRPDMDGFRKLLEDTMAEIPEAKDVDELMESVFALYEFYYEFDTSYQLANIHYCQDMTDLYWDEEYSWCMANSSEVTAGMDKLLYALADCDLREELEVEKYFGEGFFDSYEGDSLWDETFTELMNQENALVDQYYDLTAKLESDTAATEMDYVGQIEAVFANLVKVRQDIAEYAGYESYPDFAYEFYFYRDYSAADTLAYLEQIQEELVPLYLKLDSSVWTPYYQNCSETQTFNYVKECAQAMGGVAKNAFNLLEMAGLYDITYSEKKYPASFEVYLLSYYAPFIFVNPMGNQTDKMSFTHEFGHFCNDYAVGGSVVGIDVAEVFSQGLEYLSLSYCKDTKALTKMKMADSLCIFVEQAAYAKFELDVYMLEEVTVENVRKAFAGAMNDFGMSQWGIGSQDYIQVPHFFLSSMYVISYVVSNDVAMQIYQAELAETGAGVELWENGLYSMEAGLLAFVEETGLKNPFEEGRVTEIRKTFEEKLK